MRTVHARKKKAAVLREELRGLVNHIADQDLPAAKRFLAYLRGTRDPFLRNLVEAPTDDEPLSKEDIAALDEAWEDVDAGRLVPMEEVKRELGL